MLNPDDIMITDGVEVPHWLLDEAMCLENRKFIEVENIVDFTWNYLRAYALKHPLVNKPIRPCASHINIGHHGVTPHNHEPHAFTSVLYLLDAEGELRFWDNVDLAIAPKEGRFVMFPGHITHYVEASKQAELRISLVTNYEYYPT